MAVKTWKTVQQQTMGRGGGIGGFSKKGLRNTPISYIEVSEMMKRFQAAHSAVRWRRGASRGLK